MQSFNNSNVGTERRLKVHRSRKQLETRRRLVEYSRSVTCLWRVRATPAARWDKNPVLNRLHLVGLIC
jgi:hypothetical protein